MFVFFSSRRRHTSCALVLEFRRVLFRSPLPLRDAGFGREVRAAQIARRQWLGAEQLAEEKDGRTVYKRGMLATLQKRELMRIASQLSDQIGKPFVEAKHGETIQDRKSTRMNSNH